METTESTEDAVIGSRTAKGGTWTVGARLISRCLDLCTMVVLAHVLRPKDFGLVAIAMAVIYIVEAALELPLSEALVRLQEIHPEHYDTSFTLGLMRGMMLSCIVCLVGIPFARFYGDHRLLALVCVLSLAPAMRGMISPRLADRWRRLDFSPDFVMEFAGKTSAFAIAIGLALVTKSYWALAAGTVASPTVSTLTSYLIAPYRPRLSLKQLPSFSGFLGWITAAQVISAVNWQTDRLLLGKLMPQAQMGLFTAANDTASIPLNAFLSPIMRPLLSAFSAVQATAARLVHSYQASATAIITLGLPLLVAESLLAPAGIRLFLGPHWDGSAPLLRWLALSIIPSLFAAPFAPLVMTFGRTHLFVKRNLLEFFVKLPLVIVGAIKFGFMGIIVARGISEIVTVIFCMTIVRSLTQVSVKQQFTNPWRSYISTAVMAVVLAFMAPGLDRPTRPASVAISLASSIVAATVVYCGTLFALWYAADCPRGIEAMLARKFNAIVQSGRRPAEAA